MSVQKKDGQGWRLYARVARLLIDQPRTMGQVQEATGMFRSAPRLVLWRMHSAGLIHIQSWTVVGIRKAWTPIFAWGSGADAPRPPSANAGSGNKKHPRPLLIAFKAMLTELQRAPCTTRELADYCGTNWTVTTRFVRYLHELRLIRVAEWQRPGVAGGSLAPAYVFAVDGRDRERPPKVSAHERAKRGWQLRRAKQRHLELLRATAPNASRFNLAA